jgi:Nif-specific regulatory protein
LELILPEAGSVLNHRYRVLRSLGEGGMGRVFLVEDLLKGDLPVALKTLRRGLVSEEAVERFKEEFRAMTRLRHLNLAAVHDFGILEENDEPFLTLEYLDGKDLSRFTPAELRPHLPALIAQFCRALDYIHVRGVLHNDIKPQNIFLLPAPNRDDGFQFQAKLMDFGLARLVDQGGETRRSGTIHYAAPEMLAGEKVDARSDLYSLGVVLYRLATGTLPFTGKDPLAILRAHRETPPPPPRSLDPALPAGLERLILWLLEKNPEDRPRSAAALLRALNEALKTDFTLETRETRESYLTGAVLVGRDSEMEVLRSALRALVSPGEEAESRPRLVLLGGESGSGKSRLLREFRYHAQTEGLEFCLGSCYETGRAVYQPFVEAFRFLSPAARQILEARDPAGVDARTAQILAPLFPDLFPSVQPGLSVSGNDRAAKNLLFDSATQILAQAGAKRPFILALEDLHWADALSIEFLRYLRDRVPALPLLVVATYRDDEVAGRPLEALASQPSPSGTQIVLRLKRLEVDEITHLVRSMLSLDEDPQDLAFLLHRQTAGNPLFIEEILKALAEDAALEREEGRWKVDLAHLQKFEVPKNINETLTRRLSKLSDEERKIIRVLSVFNRPTPRVLLERAGGWDSEVMAPQLSHLLSRGILLRHEDGGQEKIAFAHMKTRDLVYRSVGGERTRLHLVAGQLLEDASRLRPDETLEEVAYHYLQGGAKEKGLHYAQRAGDKCSRLYAYAPALEFYQKALGLLPRTESKGRMEILSKVARIHTQSANYSEMQDYLNRGLRIARTLQDRGREGHFLVSIGYGHLLQGHFDLAVRNSRAAMALFEPLGDHLGLGRAKNHIATAYARMNQFDEAIPYFTQALEHLETAGDLEQMVNVRHNLGNVHLCQNRVEEGLRLFNEALETWRRLGDKRGIAMTVANSAQALKDLGKLDEAVASSEEAIRLYRETMDRTHLAVTLASMAEIQLARCAYDRALRFAEESLQLRREIGEPFSIPQSLDLVGSAKRLSGDVPGGMEAHQEGLRFARDHRNDLQEGFLLAALALDFLEEGKVKEATLPAERSLVLARRLRNRKMQSVALRALVAAALGASHAREAANRARDFDALAVQGGSGEERCRAAQALGQVRLAERDPAEAAVLLERALDQSLKLGRLDISAETRVFLARAAAAAGKSDKATEFLRGAAEAFRQIAGRIEDSAVRRRFLASGARRQVQEEITRAEESAPAPALPGFSGKTPPMKMLATMYEISQIINTIRDPTELLNRVLDLAIQIVGAERGLIFLREDGSEELKVRVARNLEHETIRDAGEYSQRILKQAQEGKSIVTLDAGSDERFQEYDSVSLYKIRSLACVPLRIREKVLGTVYLDSRHPGTLFGDEDLEFLEAFANQAAIAIENAQLYEALKEENRYLRKTVEERYGFANIIGKSTALERVLERAARVADSQVPVVIQGESGTGKELVARAIHHNSPRREKRFLSENVAALPETLLESELFGHVKGAFTGAEQDKAGLFELADGGTLFLDELGEMSLALQSKLLRVLQEGEIRPVGGSRSRKVDVRVLAATNRDLKSLVAEKKFREDLFYRLNVVTLTLPPLRQRPEDLPLLVEHFLEKIARQKGTKVVRVDPTVLALLMRYPWPGNVRELENTVARLSLFASGPVITLTDLARDPELLDRVAELPGGKKAPEPDLRKDDIKQALKATRGNKVQAAALLGTSRATLFRKIRQFQIKT